MQIKIASFLIAGTLGFGLFQHRCDSVNKANLSSNSNPTAVVVLANQTRELPDKSEKQTSFPSPISSKNSTPVSTPVYKGENEPPIVDPREGDDSDCDGILDISDNCQFVYNPNQKDRNHDGHGDACDPKLVDKHFTDSRCDGDSDGVPNDGDNCPLVCNPNQEDVNKNGIGDVCDPAFPNAILGQKGCLKRIKVKAPKAPKPKSEK
jgi:hypothetical protein